MSERKINKNIFEEFYSVKSYYEKNKDIYSKVCETFLNELEVYFKSYAWSKDNVDKALYVRAGQGLTFNEIANTVGTTGGTLRVRSSTITKNITEKLLENTQFNNDILNLSDETLLRFCQKLRFASINFNFYNSFTNDLLVKFNEVETQAKRISEEPTEQELYDAVYFLARFSNDALEDWLHRLNPKAIQTVIDNLKSGDFTNDLKRFVKYKDMAGYQKLPDKFKDN